MKKSLIALAAVASVSGVAYAQSNVNMYGTLSAGFGSTKIGTGTGKSYGLSAGDDHYQTSSFGITGTEDLGKGMKAYFRAEGDWDQTGRLGARAINTAETVGSAVAVTTQFVLFNRQMHLGLQSQNLGDLRVGRQNDTIKDLTGAAQLYNLSDNNHLWVGVNNRVGNAVSYESPSLGGLKLKGVYSGAPDASSSSNAGNSGSTQDTAVTHQSYRATYSVSGIDLGYGLGKETGGTTSTNVTKSQVGTIRTKVSGVDLSAIYATTKQSGTTSPYTQKTWLLSAGVDVAHNTQLIAHYVAANVNSGTLLSTYMAAAASSYGQYDGSGYGLMGVYNLSKRTALFAGYSKYDRSASSTISSGDQTVVATGVQHKF